jgi:beta-lactamase superfamily II metal-dependent hydrolase
MVDEILPEHLPEKELSIAVFGPGEGEAIVIRLPDGSVGVVDGCREPDSGDPVRELLTKLENAMPDPRSFRLRFVCLTHPHADHYRGLGRLIEAYAGRIDHLWTVTHSTPQYEKALPAWLELIQAGSAPDSADLGGLQRVLNRFHDEKQRVQRANPNGFSHLSHNKQLLSMQGVVGHDLRVEACGPADDDLDEALKQLVAILIEADKTRAVPRGHDPNLTSGALLVRWGKAAVLLAGDLLRGDKPHSGWQRARQQIDYPVQVVNVAHHASAEAHDDGLWANMRPALAIVTPFKHGKKPNPPRPEQITALARDSVVAITSPPAWDGERHRPVGARSTRLSRYGSKNAALTIVPKDRHDARRNAVAVSLDATGKITRFVLSGDADVYQAPLRNRAKATKRTAKSTKRSR